MTSEQLWIGFGLLGQALFTGRFIVQWLSSERQRKSVIPMAFWYLSISGAVVLLTYAIHRGDPVFVLGQSTGLLIYFRNLQLLGKTSKAKDAATEEEQEPVILPMVAPPDSMVDRPTSRAA